MLEKKRWTPKRIAWLAAAAVGAAFILYSIIFGNMSSKLNVKVERITIAAVERGAFQEFIPVTGMIIPISTHFLDAVEGGRVDTVYLEAGTFVNKGDKILKLANTNLLMDVMYREAELFQQSNNLRNTQLAMDRNSLDMRRQILELKREIKKQRRINESNDILAEKDLISKREYEEAQDELEYLIAKLDITRETHRQDSLFRENQVEQLETSLRRMETNLEIVKQNLENLVIKAPVTGHLTSLNAEVGESKARGVNLGQIDILDGFKVRVAIDEHYIARVSIGQTGTFTFSDNSYRLTVSKVYPEVLAGRFKVDMVFEGEEAGGIRRGQTLRIRLELGDLSEAILLPTGGFYQKTGGRWIFVVDESGKYAEKRQIHIGRENALHYEVLDGLEPGERVITSSYDSFGNVDRLVLKE